MASIFFTSAGEHPLVVHVDEDLQDLLDAIGAGDGKPISVTETGTERKVLVNPLTIAYVRG